MKTYQINLQWNPTNKDVDLICRVLEIHRSKNYVGQKFFRRSFYDQVLTCVHMYHTETTTIIVSNTGSVHKINECDFVIKETTTTLSI